MGSILDHVGIVIAADSVSVTRVGFGTPGILSCNATFPERSRSYQTLVQLAADGFTTTSPEYLAMAKVFGQENKTRICKVLRAVGKPTLVYTITPTVIDEHLYTIYVSGPSITTTTVTFTSGVGTTATLICDGLRTALDAVVGETYALSGTTTCIVTADAAGGWFSLEVANAADLAIAMTHAEPGTTIATDLNNVVQEDDDWYWLITLYNSEAYALAAAAWVESNSSPKFYVAASNATEDITTVSNGSRGMLDELKADAYTRTAGFYHPDPSQFADAALIGNLAPRTVGNWTAKFKRLAGVEIVNLTPTQRGNLIARNANSYESVASVGNVFEGTTAAGPTVLRGFIDMTVALDWVKDDMGAGIFSAMAGADKVPRTDEGMAVIEAPVRGTLDKGIKRKIVATNPPYVVDVPLISEMDDLLPRGVRLSFSFTPQGAIHNVDPVSGVVIL